MMMIIQIIALKTVPLRGAAEVLFFHPGDPPHYPGENKSPLSTSRLSADNNDALLVGWLNCFIVMLSREKFRPPL